MDSSLVSSIFSFLVFFSWEVIHVLHCWPGMSTVFNFRCILLGLLISQDSMIMELAMESNEPFLCVICDYGVYISLHLQL